MIKPENTQKILNDYEKKGKSFPKEIETLFKKF